MRGVLLWHDDVRPAPEGWVWARRNEEAMAILEQGDVVMASLDHDLGYHDVELPDDPDELAEVLLLKGQSEQTGYELVEWMVETGNVPPEIRIHSWNPGGAERMARRLMESEQVGRVIVLPYQP